MATNESSVRERTKSFLLQHPRLGRVGFAAVERLKGSRRAGKVAFTMDGLLLHLSNRGLEATACLDVGANRGEWSRRVRAAFPSASLYLIEPQEEMAATLEAYCKRTQGAKWRLAGAGAEPGMMEMSVWPGLVGSTFFNAPEIEKAYERRSVPVVTVSSLVEDGWMPVPDIVKIDVQGFELEVLRGSGRLFGHTQVFIVEVSLFPFFTAQPVFSEILAFMQENGYALYDFAGTVRRPLDNALAGLDAVFVRNDGPLRASNKWA